MTTDLIGGRIQFAFDSIATSIRYVQSNTIRCRRVDRKAITKASKRADAFRSWRPGFEVSVRFALFAPAGTPQPVIELLNSKLNSALAVPEVREAFLTVGHDPVGGEPGGPGRAGKGRFGEVVWPRLYAKKHPAGKLTFTTPTRRRPLDG